MTRRLQEPGWERIGLIDEAGRRSIWMRVNVVEGNSSLFEGIASLELCGGREGDDAYVKIEHDNPIFRPLYEVLSHSPRLPPHSDKGVGDLGW